LKVSTCIVIIVLTFINLQEKLMHLTIEERELIMIYLAQNKSKREIARLIWRSHTTVNNEIKNNSVRGKYNPSKAKHKAYVRRLHAKKNLKKIRCNNKLEEHIHEKIQDDWKVVLTILYIIFGGMVVFVHFYSNIFANILFIFILNIV